MTVLGVILLSILLVGIVLLVAAKGATPTQSIFELTRRRDELHDPVATKKLTQLSYISAIDRFRAIVVALLGIGGGFLLLAIVPYVWVAGAGAVVIVFLVSWLSRLPLIVRYSMKLRTRYESLVYPLLTKIHLLVGKPRLPKPIPVNSAVELQQVITTSKEVSMSHKRQLLAASSFADQAIGELQQPFGSADSIDAEEVLGPLVLSQLHTDGRQYIPVTLAPDTTDIVGVLPVVDLLTVRLRDTPKVKDVMIREYDRVAASDGADEVLTHLLKTGQSLVLVEDEAGKTTGLVTLRAIIDRLRGDEPSSSS